MSAKDEIVRIDGQTYTLLEASRVFQVPWSTIRQRYFHHDRGSRLVRSVKRITVTMDDKEYTLGELAMRYRLNPGTVKTRYYAGKRGKELIQAPISSYQQHRQPNNSRPIQFRGRSRTLRSLSDEYGIGCGTLRGRYYRGDRDDELVRPIGVNLRQSRAPLYVTVNGEEHTFKELSRIYHVSVGIIHDRYYQGKQGTELVQPRKRHFGGQ